MGTTPDIATASHHTTMAPPTISRRALLSGLAGTGGLLLLGCSASPSSTTAATNAPTNAPKLALQGRFDPNTFVVAGVAQRLVVSLLGIDGSVVMDVPEQVTFRLTQDGKDVGAPLPTAARKDGVPIPYYAVEATVPSPGTYALVADGPDARSTTFRAVAADASSLVRPGQPMPSADTPTTADPRGVKPICTAGQPCPFHRTNLRDALATGQPLVLLVSTPKYCQIGICGPVLDLVIEQAAAHPGVQVVHAEVYTDPASGTMTTAPIISAMGLEHEPALFGVTSDGVVRNRLDFVFDRGEIKRAFDELTA